MYLVVSTHLKNVSQIAFWVKIKSLWNQQLQLCTWSSLRSLSFFSRISNILSSFKFCNSHLVVWILERQMKRFSLRKSHTLTGCSVVLLLIDIDRCIKVEGMFIGYSWTNLEKNVILGLGVHPKVSSPKNYKNFFPHFDLLKVVGKNWKYSPNGDLMNLMVIYHGRK